MEGGIKLAETNWKEAVDVFTEKIKKTAKEMENPKEEIEKAVQEMKNTLGWTGSKRTDKD